MDAEGTESRLSERTQHLIRIYKPLHDIKIYLDLGCGTGTITREVAMHYGVVQAIGVDLPPPSDADSNGPIVILKATTATTEDQQQGSGLPPAATTATPTTTTVWGRSKKTVSPPPPSYVGTTSTSGRSPPSHPKNLSRSHDTTYEYRQLQSDGIIPVEDNSVDFITCIMAIHHFENFDQMISEVKRVLSPNGVLFIREHDVPRKDKLLAKSLDNMHENFSDHTTSGVINYWPRDELKSKLVDGFGFKHVFDDDYPPGTPNPQKIYHSLYAKELGELKYIPPWERKVQSSAAVTTQQQAGSGSKIGGSKETGSASGVATNNKPEIAPSVGGGLMGRFDSVPSPPPPAQVQEDRFAGLVNRGGTSGGNSSTAGSGGKQVYRAKGSGGNTSKNNAGSSNSSSNNGSKGGGSSAAGNWRK